MKYILSRPIAPQPCPKNIELRFQSRKPEAGATAVVEIGHRTDFQSRRRSHLQLRVDEFTFVPCKHGDICREGFLVSKALRLVLAKKGQRA